MLNLVILSVSEVSINLKRALNSLDFSLFIVFKLTQGLNLGVISCLRP